MNSKINKVIDDIEKTKTKIAELQALLPELERKRVDMENTEIIKLLRSANIAPADIPDFIEKIKTSGTNLPNLADDEYTKPSYPSSVLRESLANDVNSNLKHTKNDDDSEVEE